MFGLSLLVVLARDLQLNRPDCKMAATHKKDSWRLLLESFKLNQNKMPDFVTDSRALVKFAQCIT